MEDEEVIREFLIESNENLGQLDQDMVVLEQRPKDRELLAGIFRSIHTIKGTCGFLGLVKLGKIAHATEDVLGQLRDGHLELTPELVTLILQGVDAIKGLLRKIEETGEEGDASHDELCEKLRQAATEAKRPARQPESAPPPPIAVIPQPTAPTAATQAPPAKTAQPAAAVAQTFVETPAPAPLKAETTAAPEESDAARQRDLNVADSTIRVDVGLLDSLMNLVGELVLARNQILQFNSQQEHATLNATSQRLNLITTELQEGVMKTRMQPIGVVYNKLPRLVRDLSVTFGKQIVLELEGAETELDKTIIEAIKDPLTHIVRNCCDHGIELPEVRAARGKPAQGRLTLRAYHEGGQVNIEISDDGGGIDAQRVREKAVQKGMLRPEQATRMSERELLNLVFQPGFSTAAAVTAVSGRGVGMDVVRTNIEKIGGAVDLSSKPGEGTTVKLKIPLTLAIIPGLVITSGGERFIIPQVSLLELIRLEGEAGRNQIQWIRNTPVYRRRGSLLPIAHLNRVLKLGEENGSDVINIVVLQAEDRQFGLVVDGISDTQEIVVKPLGKQLKCLSCYAGATIMGDGRVALILDALGIGQLSGVLADTQGAARAESEQKAAARSASQTFLLFRAGTFDRLAVPLSLVARLEEFTQARVEHAGGSSVVQYRDSILSLLPLSEILEPGSGDTAGSRDPVQVIVFNHGTRTVGLVVDQILDIVEDEVTARRPTERAGLLGSAVIGKKVTDLLDLGAVLSAAGQNWFEDEQKKTGEAPTILLAESSAFFAGMLRSRLEMAGYRVHQADNREELFDEFGRGGLAALLVDDNFAPAGAPALLKEIQSYPEARNLPVLVLDGVNGPINGHDGQPAAMVKRDPTAVLAALEGLACRASKNVPA